MKKMLWPAYLFLFAFIWGLAACSTNVLPMPDTHDPLPTPVPVKTVTVQTSANCLIGTWQSTDLSGYLRSVYSQGVARTAYFASTSGSYRFQFNSDGTA